MGNGIHRRALLKAGLAAGGAWALGGTNRATAQAGWDATVAAAKQEGRLIVYNGTNFIIVRKIAAKFQAETGIQTDVLDGRATEIRERIRVEQATSRTIASLTYTGATTLATQKSEGAFQPMGALPNAGRIDPQFKPDETIIPVTAGNFATIINTNLVKGADIPKTWADFTHPKWKDKILADDPRAAGAGNVWFEATYNAFGRGFHEKMAAQNMVISRLFPESQRRLARGEYAIYLPFNVSELKGLQGLPVQCLIPAEGVPYVPFCYSLLKDAPQPNAARLFVNYMLAEAAQVAQAEEGFKPAVMGLSEKIPADLRPYVDVKLLGTTTPGRQNEMFDLARAIYGTA
ncbi:MAG: Ferric transporter ATP-binding subunit [Hyphomicrobiales bacterium]|nr:Ferric transporter ATP-binding subunit [Hyphomicrobiales bacterium]